MTEFWSDCGFQLLDRKSNGYLKVTDDFLRTYLRRPEIEPIEDSCEVEREIHAALLENPQRQVPPETIAAMADDDVTENYQILLAFRDRLLASGSLEECYLGLFQSPIDRIPPIFIDQLAQVILRNILDDTTYPLWARAAEILFREQRISRQDGAILAADAGFVAAGLSGSTPAHTDISSHGSGREQPAIELDILHDHNGDIYWPRSDSYDTVLDLRLWGQGHEALCRVLEKWVNHFYQVPTHIQPREELAMENWRWHIGLDANSSELLNAMYNGVEAAESQSQNLLSLFQMEIRDSSLIRGDLAGQPIYLGMAMTANNTLRLKPQNLLVNLPLAKSS